MPDRIYRLPSRRVTRRSFLRGSMALGAGAFAVPWLASCVAPAAAPAASADPTATPDMGPDPKSLQPFAPSATAGEVPDLPRRIAWANTSDAEFFLAITNSIQLAAEDRDLEFITAIAN